MAKINGAGLMFNEESVKKTTEFLPRLARIIFYYYGITNDNYLDRYKDYWLRVFPGKTRKEFSQKSVADRKVLLDPTQMTMKMLRNILQAMGFDLESVSIKVKDRLTGEVKEFSTDDTIEKLKSMMDEEKEIGIGSL